MKYRDSLGILSVPATWRSAYMDVIVHTIFFRAWLPCFAFLTGYLVKLSLARNSSSVELFKVIETTVSKKIKFQSSI
jgi:hypothetical protein